AGHGVAGAAENRVGADRPEARRIEPKEVGAVADQVVLAQVAVDQVITAVALRVVVAVRRLSEGVENERRPVDGDAWDDEGTGRRRGGAGHVNRPVALDDVVAQLAEDDVIAGAAGGRVVAVEAGRRGRVAGGVAGVVEQHDRAAGAVVGVGLGGRRDLGAAVGAVDHGTGKGAEARAEFAADVADDAGVVTGDGVVARAAVEDVTGISATLDVVAADEVVVARAAEHDVAALPAEDGVVDGVAQDGVVAAAVGRAGEGREEIVVGRQRRVDRAVVAEDQVVAVVSGRRVAGVAGDA